MIVCDYVYKLNLIFVITTVKKTSAGTSRDEAAAAGVSKALALTPKLPKVETYDYNGKSIIIIYVISGQSFLNLQIVPEIMPFPRIKRRALHFTHFGILNY